MPPTDPTLETIVALYKEAHERLRDEVRAMTPAQLAWAPAPDTNSVAVLVVHTLGSEAEIFRVARDVTGSRDRDGEFKTEGMTADDLLAQLDAADALLDEAVPQITAADLDAARSRGGSAPIPVRSMMIKNYGHAREHLAHIQLTKQVMAAAEV